MHLTAQKVPSVSSAACDLTSYPVMVSIRCLVCPGRLLKNSQEQRGSKHVQSRTNPSHSVQSLQCVVSGHCQVEARLADVGLHAVNGLAIGGADHLGIKQLDDIWNRSEWRAK